MPHQFDPERLSELIHRQINELEFIRAAKNREGKDTMWESDLLQRLRDVVVALEIYAKHMAQS